MIYKIDGYDYVFESLTKSGAVLFPLSYYTKYNGNIFIGKIKELNIDQKIKIKLRLTQLIGVSYENLVVFKVLQKLLIGKATKFSKIR